MKVGSKPFARAMRRYAAIFCLCLTAGFGLSSSVCAAAPARIAILGAMPPLSDAADASRIAGLLKARGDDAIVLSPVQLTDVNSFGVSRFQLLILPHSDLFPAQALPNLLNFLKGKGRLICLNGPALSRLVYTDGRDWMTLHDRLSNLNFQPMFDPSKIDSALWQIAAAAPDANPTLKIEESPHGAAISLRFEHYHNWASVAPPKFTVSPFKPGTTLISFWAKGDDRTQAAVLEWVEADGSRWLAPVPLTNDWRRVTLLPTDFKYWQDSQSKGRGGPNDHFSPQAASILRIGLADSHSAETPGAHQFWLADFGCAALPGDMPMQAASAPNLEALAPIHKQVHDTISGLWLPVLRDRGIGTSGERSGRLLPVNLDSAVFPTAVTDYKDWVRVALKGPYQGAIWGGGADYSAATTDKQLVNLVDRALQNVFIVRAGAQKCVNDIGKPIGLSAYLINLGPATETLSVEQKMYRLSDSKATEIFQSGGEAQVESGKQIEAAPAEIKIATPGVYRYTAKLYSVEGHRLLDRLEMTIRVVPSENPPNAAASLLHVEGSEFVQNGKVFRPVGVNFWPLNVAGQESPAYFSGWLAPDQYDADLVEQDLARCENIGINLVSVQYSRPEEGVDLQDFLARCHHHHILANVFISNADPRDLHRDKLKALLDAARLRNNPDLFAFDVAWEPHLGKQDVRSHYDNIWRKWIDDNYGPIESAEAAWKFAAPRKDALIIGPDDVQISSDGPWRIMVAAYRRFVDEMLSKGYRDVKSALRSLGADALVGARSGYGGNGFPGVDPEMPFDLRAGAAHLDFISPEGYALSGDWPAFRSGGFTAVYARWAGAGKPVFWAEFGTSVYPGTSPVRLAVQHDTIDKMLRTVIDSRSNGAAVWWLPGGLRIDENSDFGIFEPDGTARPAALRFKTFAAQELPSMQLDAKIDSILIGDRDSDARGYSSIYEELRTVYSQMRSKGNIVAFRSPGEKFTTADMPLEQIGGAPATVKSPLRFVNGEIYFDDATHDKLRLLNTGEAAWRTAGSGAVVLLVSKQGANAPIVLRLTGLPEKIERLGSALLPIQTLRSAAGGAANITVKLAISSRSDMQNGAKYLQFGETIDLNLE